jgi:hypothetical protein
MTRDDVAALEGVLCRLFHGLVYPIPAETSEEMQKRNRRLRWHIRRALRCWLWSPMNLNVEALLPKAEDPQGVVVDITDTVGKEAPSTP